MNINDILSKIEKYPLKNRLLIFLTICVLILVGYWYFIFNPKYNKISSLKKKITELDKQIQKNRKKIVHKKKLKKELEEKKRIYYYAKKLLPDTNIEVENLLANIETLGNDVGVEFLLFQPGKEIILDFYARRSVKLKLKGHFHNLMLFFSHISNLNRLVTLDSVKFRPNKEQVLTADCSISIYRSLTQKEIEAKENKNKKKKGNKRKKR